MKVVEITAPGAPEVLKSAERPVPAPKSSEVLVKVAAAGVNGPDLMQRRLYPPPAGATDPRSEVSGKWSPSVTPSNAGRSATRLPDSPAATATPSAVIDARTARFRGVSLRDAAGLPETYFTVWSNVFVVAGLKSGETFLVHGGAGGIGTTAIQLGKAFGAKVIATDSPEERCAICRELGADRVVDYRREDFVEAVRSEGGANVILDIVGGANIEKNFKSASHDARIIQLAFALGSGRHQSDAVMLKRIPIRFPLHARHRIQDRVAGNSSQVGPGSSGGIRVVTHERFRRRPPEPMP
jgi:NADPH:quinone reductase-like Zn-dependent oxidoreductase